MKTVFVRANAIEPGKEGYFFRGGHRFSTAGRTVEVTPELYKVLRSESRLAVMIPEEDGPPVENEGKPLDVIDNRVAYDHEWNESRQAREEVGKLKARKLVLEVEVERAKLAREVKDLEEMKTELDAEAKAKAKAAAKAAKAAEKGPEVK